MSVPVHPVFDKNGSFADMQLGRVKEENRLTVALKAKKYILPGYTPPTEVDWTTKISAWGMFDNNNLGNCTWAAIGNMTICWSTNAGAPVTPLTTDIDEGYWETGDPPSAAGTPGGPTDNGRDERSVLTFMQQEGIPNETNKIDGFAQADLGEYESIIALFGGIYLGVELPITAQTQTVWDVVGDPQHDPKSQPGSWGGHAVPALAYNSGGSGNITIITWGAPLEMTSEFWSTYVDEGYAVISPDWFNSQGEAASNVDLAQLQTDLLSIESTGT